MNRETKLWKLPKHERASVDSRTKQIQQQLKADRDAMTFHSNMVEFLKNRVAQYETELVNLINLTK